MSLIRLFIDEDSMDRQFVRALRARGVDVATVAIRLNVYIPHSALSTVTVDNFEQVEVTDGS